MHTFVGDSSSAVANTVVAARGVQKARLTFKAALAVADMRGGPASRELGAAEQAEPEQGRANTVIVQI